MEIDNGFETKFNTLIKWNILVILSLVDGSVCSIVLFSLKERHHQGNIKRLNISITTCIELSYVFDLLMMTRK